MAKPRQQREKDIRKQKDIVLDSKKQRMKEIFELSGIEKCEYDISILESRIKSVQYDLANNFSGKQFVINKLHDLERQLKTKKEELMKLEKEETKKIEVEHVNQ